MKKRLSNVEKYHLLSKFCKTSLLPFTLLPTLALTMSVGFHKTSFVKTTSAEETFSKVALVTPVDSEAERDEAIKRARKRLEELFKQIHELESLISFLEQILKKVPEHEAQEFIRNLGVWKTKLAKLRLEALKMEFKASQQEAQSSRN